MMLPTLQCLFLIAFLCGKSEAFSRQQLLTTERPRRRQVRSSACRSVTSTRSFLRAHQNESDSSDTSGNQLERRRFLASVASSSLSSLSLLFTPNQQPALAKGLVQFPLTKPLFNSYTFMRVGTTLLEEEDIWSTNPLFLTNRDDALSPTGQTQVAEACQQVWLQSQSSTTSTTTTTTTSTTNIRPPTIIIHSLAAAAMDTANILQQQLQLGRDRIRPEFTFMDPRAIGQYDLLTRSTTLPAIWALDADEAGERGKGGRPPPNEDGTPNETLADQAVRLRQLFSVLESQYSGEAIVLVFPDGTGPALLACMMAGIPYSQVHRLELAPAQIWTNVTPDSIRARYQAVLASPDQEAQYQQTLQKGRQQLATLRERDEWTNRKDEILESERLAYEQTLREKAEAEAAAQALAERERQARAAAVAGTNPSRSSDDGEISPSVLVGGGVVAAWAGLTQLYPSSEQDEDSLTISSSNGNVTVSSSSLYSSPPSAGSGNNATLFNNGNRNVVPPATRRATTTTTTTTSSLYSNNNDLRDVGVNGDPMGQLLTEQGRQKAAAQAMKDYLEQDDGGDAWLTSISEILSEDDLGTNETSDSSFN